jgi:hypothetical protein
MNIITKYDIGQQVFFLYAIKTPTNVGVYTGIVKNIEISCDDHYLLVNYKIDTLYDDHLSHRDCPAELEISEHYLYKDGKDLLKIFNENIRNYLNPENLEILKRKRKEYDDLPF